MNNSLVFLKRRVIQGREFKSGDAYPSDIPLAPHLVTQLVDMRVLTTKEDYDRMKAKVAAKAVKVEKVETPKVEVKTETTKEDKYTKEQLQDLKMNEVRKIGNKFDVKDNDKDELIQKILDKQG